VVKKNTIWLIVLLAFLAADPASAWFWEKNEVKAPEVTREVKEHSTETVRKKGFVASIKETGRDIKKFFKGLGKEVKETSKKVPGEAKKESKEVGKSLKRTGKKIAKESKKVPGVFKKGAKEIGKGFKKLGKDIKGETKKALEE
jgi:hypothetical protein